MMVVADSDKFVRVEAPHFVAGFFISRTDRRSIGGAPILNWTIGKHEGELRTYFRRKGWKATVLKDFDP
jgi:hypothetical protein